MKTNKLKMALILMVCGNLLFSISVSSQNSEKSSSNIKSIALISTMIGKIKQSPLPLLDATPFNNKTNSIAPLIIKEEKEIINWYRVSVASSLKKHFNCEVLYGDTLIAKPEYQEIIKKYNFPDNLKTGDENFPQIHIPKDEKNLFMFDDGSKNVQKCLKNEEKTKSTTSEICKLLGTDLVAVSYSFMDIVKYGAFGSYAKVSLMTFIYLYNKEGKLIGKAYNSSKPVLAVGDEVMGYETVLGTLPDILDKVVIKVKKRI